MSIMPPYSDYNFRINRFTHYVNDDTYGEYGKGNYSIKKDTLILNFADLKSDNTIVVNVDSTKHDNFHYNFKIVEKHLKEAFIGANIVICNKNGLIINKGVTNYDGKLDLNCVELADKIIVVYIGFDQITIQKKFGYTNNIYIEWDSNWLRKIGKSTEKYKIIEKKRNFVRLENSKHDSLSLIRKRYIKKLEN